MKADQILRAGLDTLVQRGVKRDQPDGERSMPRIVRVFEAITGITLTEREGLLFMISMKLVREGRGAPDADDYIDLANYVALCGEAALSHPTDAFIGASMYGLPPLDPPANVGTIDATAYRWHELQALLRQRDEQLAGTGPSVTLDAAGNLSGPAGTHNVAEVPDDVCPVCAGDGFENRKLGTLCRTCTGTGQC